MSENRNPLVPHPDRPGVWVRGEAETPGLFTDRPGLVEQVVIWAAAAVAGWTMFALAHLVAEVVLLVLGVRRSLLVAASIGAVAGVAAWAAERRKQ